MMSEAIADTISASSGALESSLGSDRPSVCVPETVCCEALKTFSGRVHDHKNVSTIGLLLQAHSLYYVDGNRTQGGLSAFGELLEPSRSPVHLRVRMRSDLHKLPDDSVR